MAHLYPRRDFLGYALRLSAAYTASGLVTQIQPGSLKVVCVGGHPDDPESGCGGTLSMYAAAGHKVTVIYLTRGERGIQGKSLDEAAKIRTAEAQLAMQTLTSGATWPAATEYRSLASFSLTHAQGCDIVTGILQLEANQ